MTVKDFALAAHEPKEMTVLVCGEEYSLMGPNSGNVDPLLLAAFGDYLIHDFKANEPDKYCIWVKEVPVKKGEAA